MPVINMTYDQARPLLRDGDVVFFSSHNGIGDKIIKWWQRVVHGKDPEEGNQYSHIGLVLTLGKRVWLLEASFRGGVRMVPLSRRQPDLICQMGLVWNDRAEETAMKNMGNRYGLWEAVKAALGLRKTEDDKFICTEYVEDVCEDMGYRFPSCKQLPSNFYAQLIKEGKSMIKIVDPAHSEI